MGRLMIAVVMLPALAMGAYYAFVAVVTVRAVWLAWLKPLLGVVSAALPSSVRTVVYLLVALVVFMSWIMMKLVVRIEDTAQLVVHRFNLLDYRLSRLETAISELGIEKV